MLRNIIGLIILSSSLVSFGQNLAKEKSIQLKLRGNGAIFQKGIVKGYYFYYEVEKKDKTTNNYILRVLDENIQDVSYVDFSKPLGYQLIESSYNGTSFVFLFFDSKGKKIDLVTFDNTLKQMGEIEKPVKDPEMLRMYKDAALGFEGGDKYLAPLNDIGFLQFENGVIHAYSNKLDSLWKQTVSGFPSDGFQSNSLSGHLVTNLSSKVRGVEYYLIANNPRTGDLHFSIAINSPIYNIAPHNITYDSTTQRVVVFGEYFKKEDNPLTDVSLGFCNLVYDANGKYLSSKTIAKDNLLSKPLINYNGKNEELGRSILFHDYIRTKDGKVFAIGEEYKKSAGAGRILLSQYMSPVVFNVYNLVVLEFNEDNDLAKIHIFNKNRSKVQLSHDGLFTSHKALSRYVKKMGGFDFRFSQEFPGNEAFSIVYKDLDKRGGQEILGTVVYAPEKVFRYDKILFKRESVKVAILPAKPGYVLIAEYFKKEKKFDMRLEKINY